MTDRVAQLSNIQNEARELFKKKNADYGDAFATYGAVGVIVRMGDKISRLSSITSTGINLVDTESLRDTLIDLHNYAAMAIMLLDEQKLTTSPIKKSNSLLICSQPRISLQLSSSLQDSSAATKKTSLHSIDAFVLFEKLNSSASLAAVAEE